MNEFFFETIDSTNLFAKNNIQNFDKTKVTCISAEKQTNGYGQFGRKWLSPPSGNLYTTFCFTLSKPVKDLEKMAIHMAICLKEVLAEEGFHPTIKWPNDVLLNEKKIAGVLCETIFEETYVQIILGFGLNVNMQEHEISQIDQKATSLFLESGRFFDQKALLKKIQKKVLTKLITNDHTKIIP